MCVQRSNVPYFINVACLFRYNKTEGLAPEELIRFDYLLIGGSSKELERAKSNFSGSHREYFSVKAFNGIKYSNYLPYFLMNFKNHLLDSVIKRVRIPWIELRTKVIVFKKK